VLYLQLSHLLYVVLARDLKMVLKSETWNLIGQNGLKCSAVEDLMTLVQACRNAPDMEARLRETLNMARDAEKWRNLMRMLTEKVRRRGSGVL
jgi:hypothetical protein